MHTHVAKKRPRDKSEADTGKPPKKKKAEGLFYMRFSLVCSLSNFMQQLLLQISTVETGC